MASAMRWPATLLFVTACGAAAAPIPRRSADPPPRPPPVAGPASQDLGGWRELTKATPRRFRTRGHGQVWVDVFVSPEHAAAYLARVAPAPVGLRVVMAGADDEAGPIVGLMAMVKMPPGYDATGGDWYYAVLDPDGRTARAQGALPVCAHCHHNARSGDYLYGLSEEATSPRAAPPPPPPSESR